MSQIDRSLAEAARAWPFEEARKLVARLGGKPPAKGYVLFETGYGPSGLPHIGTFGEVVRTTMVRQAFRRLSDVPTRLYCFSDDMDGLRKVPDNVPNKEMLAAHLGKPLTSVPDPFSNEHPSFGAANNARLRAFLDSQGVATFKVPEQVAIWESLPRNDAGKVLKHQIRATLAAARQCGFGKLHVIFQPHRYTRTQLLLDDFATAFQEADSVLVLDIYAASEAPIPGITAESLAERIMQAGGTRARHPRR